MNWQPIETAPKDGSTFAVLILDPWLMIKKPMIGYFDTRFDQIVVYEGDYISTCFTPLKWYPLPETE